MSKLKWMAHGKPRAFQWDNPRDSSNAIVVVADESGLHVNVADEQAVDSYNADFTCSITLPPAQAIKLRDALNAWFPEGQQR